MATRKRVFAALAVAFWVFSLMTFAACCCRAGYVVGWDLGVYHDALVSLRTGHDPYLACVTARKMYFDHLAAHPRAPIPYGYIYPPITLYVLRMLSYLPMPAVGVVYWTMYAAGAAAIVWASAFPIRRTEWMGFALVAPSTLFFPGMILSDPLFSGNVAYLLYGAILAGGVLGWRTGRWNLFYITVLAASIVKPTFLSLLAIPVLTTRDPWIPAVATAAASGFCNLLQEALWPVLFHNYKMSLESQVVTYIHDFGFHPAGILADALYTTVPYRITFGVLYGVCAVIFGAILLYLRRRFLDGEIPLQEWIPVVLIGATLLNPRIMQYDLLPVTLPMAVVGWRCLRVWIRHRVVAIAAMLSIVGVLNVAGNYAWKQTECLLLVGLFFAGSWSLVRESLRDKRVHVAEQVLVLTAQG